VRYLLSAVWILLTAGAASADWNEAMAKLERAASGTDYEIGADPGDPEWVAIRKARYENERSRIRGVDLGSEILRAQIACRESTAGGAIANCE